MIEELKSLQCEDTIIFTDEQVVDLLETEEFTITSVKTYYSDDYEIVVVGMDESYLVVHNFESDEKCFFYKLVNSGDTVDLEDEGYKFLNEEDEFRHKIVIREEGKAFIYHPSDVGSFYGLAKEANDEDDPQEVSICEFRSPAANFEYILIVREDDSASIMQGFEIGEDGFELSKASE